MEALLPYLVPLLLIALISLYLLSSSPGKKPKNSPPGSKGWPILGENVAFAFFGPRKFVRNRMQKHSPEVFKTSLIGEEMAVFCGAQGNKLIFTNDTKLFKAWYPKSVKKALLFPGLVIDDDMQALLRSFRFQVLKPDAVKHYIPVMDAMTRDEMDTHWVPNSVVKVFPLALKYTFDLGCRLFMSLVDEDQIKKLLDSFIEVTDGLISVPIDLPGTAYNRAIKGGRLVREELMRIIAERRKETTMTMDDEEGPQDILSKMLMVRDGDGEFLSEMVICNSIVGLILSSFETTTSAVTAVANYLAELPHVYSRVFQEQMEIAETKGPDELLTWEDIEKMKYSWNVARESLRLVPPAVGGFREATTDFTYADFTIPKGWKTFWTVHTSHQNPNYFAEPEKFDPSRFEGGGPPPYTFVPFGGGPRMCPGKEYARMEILVFMHNLVTRFKLEKAIPNEKIICHNFPRPAHGLPLHLHPHKK